jgi:site-specific DNA-methyltransferase (adenine-specific)
MDFQLWHGCCLEEMKKIKDNSIDMVLTDPPYGTTACKWDTVIPFEPMWKELKRITKDNGAICLFGTQPFTAVLISSNLKMYKYDWIWEKSHATGFLNAWRQPLRNSEVISVFYQKQVLYNPQIFDKKPENIRPLSNQTKKTDNYGNYKKLDKENRKLPNNKTMPKTIIKFNIENNRKGKLHPTQKPIKLLEYLLRTYTLENETVLDFTMGSGSTGVACKNLNRKFIGIEKEEKYFNIAKERILT